MSSVPIPMRPLMPPVAVTTAEARADLFERDHADHLAKVHAKASLRRFVAPVHPQPSKRSGHRLTEADLDCFFASLNRQLVPSALANDAAAQVIAREFWAARRAAHAEVERRLNDERSSDDTTLKAAENVITQAFLQADRVHLSAFVGQAGVEPIELALALWHSHAAAWFALATTVDALWPKVAALSSRKSGRDVVEHRHLDRRFAGDAPRLCSAGPRNGMSLYRAMLDERR